MDSPDTRSDCNNVDGDDDIHVDFNLLTYPPPPPLEPPQQPILGQNAPIQDLSQHLERLRPSRTRQSTRLDYKALHTRGKKF